MPNLMNTRLVLVLLRWGNDLGKSAFEEIWTLSLTPRFSWVRAEIASPPTLSRVSAARVAITCIRPAMRSLRKLVFSALLSLICLPLLALTSGAAQTAPRPNIIFILVDDLRWDALGCMGHP